MCLSWLVVFHVPSIRPGLVEDDVDPDLFKERFCATLGVVLCSIAGVAGWRLFHELAVSRAGRGDSLSALGNLMRPTDARDLHGRKPPFPHRRIDRRSIGPFQTTYEKLNLLVGLAVALPNGLEEYPHRVIAFNYRDRVDHVHDVHAK
jgi:hypothetical protein